MKKILVHGIKEKTPMGFCDVPRKNLLDFLRDMKSISVPNEPRYKPLKKIHRAASEGDAQRLQRMISLGKHSVNDKDFKERTALHFACAYGQVEIVNVLLKNNCDIDAVDRNSITPLMKAVQNWTYGCVCALLKHGADPNRMDKNGNTSLHYAVSEDNQTLAKCLLKYNADMEIKNKDGFTPLLLALKENKIEMAKFLVRKGANIHVFDEMKRNTLLYAVRWDSKDMVSLLLDEGVDFFFKDVFGWTALRYAIEGTSKGSREILMNYDEKLRRKNKDDSLEYKNSEDNLLPKHHNDPTSVSTLPKSNENECDFDDELDTSKYALAKCPNNFRGAGDQRDKNESSGTVDDSSKEQLMSKPAIEKVDSVAYEESGSNQEESTLAESDIFTTESLEEKVSDDSENIQPSV
ncbi:ankyrin repeat domain-containing protein 7-like [Psammomys obesus]|uniref:ankyrin repeat domain-containing protein 7-like n=1 Tax=Psammomys obesus TaxID=48139 RepID=UPI002452E827|nr:ankyrin repeat domain-containing protein 7-like [Psammomys obesus]